MTVAHDIGNQVVRSRVHRERDAFIASIPHERVLQLASSHHRGEPCAFFQEPARGSYNICYFVRFDSGEKWVVRVPLGPCLAFGARHKLESEIATMQLIAEKTSIPIPKIVAYALADGPDPLSSFLILEYVDGKRFAYTSRMKDISDDQQLRLFTSLADIYIQLRRLEFPSIGCLTRSADGFCVSKKTVSIDLNSQELEGLRPSEIQASYYDRGGGRLTSANDYAAMLLDIADNAFAKGQGTVWEQDQGEDALYHLYIFRKFAQEWVNDRLDHGPFVLFHSDLEPYNLLVDDDMNIKAVLDWEWSRVVPLQYFIPPLWFGIPDTTLLAHKFVYQDYLTHFDRFLEIARDREQAMFAEAKLADEWEIAKRDSGFLVANALENWTDMDWFAFRYVNLWRYGGRSDLQARVKAFIEEDPARRSLIASKVPQGIAYKAATEKQHDEAPTTPHLQRR